MKRLASPLLLLGLLLTATLLLKSIGCGRVVEEDNSSTTTTSTTTTSTSTTTTLPGRISGTITWPQFNDVPLPGVIASLNGTTQTTTCDVNGQFSFTELPSGTYSVSFAQTGWIFYPSSESVTIGSDTITQNATAELDGWHVIPTGTTDNLNAIGYDGNHFLIGGDNGALLYSSDSGATWTNYSYGSGTGNYEYPTSESIGLATVTNSTPTFAIGEKNGNLRSWDGTQWINSFLGQDQAPIPFINAASDNNYYLVSNDNKLFRSPDLINTTELFPGLEVIGIYAVDTDNDDIDELFVVGKNGWFNKSNDDNGASWQTAEQLANLTDDLQGISFGDAAGDTVGFIVTAQGNILWSITHGSYWGIRVKGLPVSLNGILITNENPNVTYICGDDGLLLTK
ncbi:MAG: carboxypeptidase regulatory-like domain-containing protein [bacterium]